MPPVRTDARVEDTMWVVNDVKRDMEQDSTDARYPDPGDVANPRRADLSGSSPINRATATQIMCCQLCVG